ncbi:MAG: type VI secretion system contractile sheath large subunit [Myxococcales bacterium]|nr:type VI secretion system contractile sheath large subunit [Myxococcales bacterium]
MTVTETQPETQTADATPCVSDLTRSVIEQVVSLEEYGEARQRAADGLSKVVRRVLEKNTTPASAVAEIQEQIAELNQQIEAHLNAVLHHPEFQKLESAWRGLEHMVKNTPNRNNIHVRVLPVSKKELAKSLRRYEGDWQQSPLFKLVYAGIDQPNNTPYACIIGGYEFDHSKPDVDMLLQLSKTAAACHAPFIAAASPRLLGIERWGQVNDPPDLTSLMNSDADKASWRSLREKDDAKYLALATNRPMARPPYGEHNPVDGMDGFTEHVEGTDASKFVWMNPAYAIGANINKAFDRYGWCIKIRDNEAGRVEGLPVYTFKDEYGAQALTCPTEVEIGNMLAQEMNSLGLVALQHHKGTDFGVFQALPSIQKPAEYDDPDTRADAKLAAKLQYILGLSRFAHSLNRMATSWRGQFATGKQLEQRLARWVGRYILANPDAPGMGEEAKAARPLRDAKIAIEAIEGEPGFYSAEISLLPHYQLEGLKASLRLQSRIRDKQ